MTKLFILLIFFFTALNFKSSAQEKSSGDQFGKTLNLGLGIGYYGYVTSSLPVLHLDYEFDVAKNFTLAPFINFYSYRNFSYWGNSGNPYRNYYYRETVIPIGAKGFYYFDELLHAAANWDFYLAGSLGFAISTITYENNYYGSRNLSRASPLYIGLHVGGEYHINQKIGLYLDLSTGVSTIGLAVHH